jgi:arabinan endo-1,5-alpha-L-arabinosidase
LNCESILISGVLLTWLVTSAPAQTAATTQPRFGAADHEHVLQLGSRNIRAHDPSTIARCGDDYWVFSTGRGIISLHSKDLKTWERVQPVFSTAPKWNSEVVPGTRPLGYWAPDIIHVGDRYLLYYSVSIFGKNTSAIGLATNVTLDPSDPKFKWIDEGPVISCDGKQNYNTIDPSVMLDRDGKLWLAFGSYWSGIKLIELDPKTGKRIAPDSPMHSLAHARDIEAACIFRHNDDYILFVNWGTCCRGVNSTYNIRVGKSKTITGPYLDRDGKDLMNGGGSLVAATDGAFVGPGHAGLLCESDRCWMSMHFYDGSNNGIGTLAIREVTWDADAFPVLK